MHPPADDPTELEQLLRHRVTGIVAAAEGRAKQLTARAEREVEEARREALSDMLAAVRDAQSELELFAARLAVTVAQLELAIAGTSRPPEVEPRVAAGAEPASPDPDLPQPRSGFARASMRDRPVAALFGLSAAAPG